MEGWGTENSWQREKCEPSPRKRKEFEDLLHVQYVLPSVCVGEGYGVGRGEGRWGVGDQAWDEAPEAVRVKSRGGRHTISGVNGKPWKGFQKNDMVRF